jgi:hypothetical protein|tara:strand:- start:20560 stop:21174 length:615 start_codon:yes stop_codon:yes gene_type:complete
MNTLPRSLLTPDKVLLIKEKLWDGMLKQREIAEEFYVTQTTISRIFRGHEHPDVPWPDNSTGSIPEARWETLIKSKRRGARYANSQRQEPTEEVKSAAKKVATALDAMDTSLDSEFSAIIGKPSNKRKGKGTRAKKSKLLPWSTIKEQDPAHPLIREVEAKGDGYLKAAVMLVLKNIPLEEWQRDATLALIESTRKKIKENKKV